VLNNKIEAELVAVIRQLAQRGFPLGMKEVCAVAFTYTKQNGLHSFSEKKQKDSYEWFYDFMIQHSDISLGKPEHTCTVMYSMQVCIHSDNCTPDECSKLLTASGVTQPMLFDLSGQ